MSQAQTNKTRKPRSVFARLASGIRRPASIHDFHGGIHPPEMKHLSNGTPIMPGPLPEQLVLPLNMHIGAPAKPLVAPGDKVLKGQMIAEPIGAVSAAIHAPHFWHHQRHRPAPHPAPIGHGCGVYRYRHGWRRPVD